MSATEYQNDRVQAWLEAHGATTIADWDREPACDGGNKITRLAARILDLERKRKVQIDKSEFVTLGKSRVKLYRLKPSPAPATCIGQLSDTPVLVNVNVGPQCALFDDWDEAA